MKKTISGLIMGTICIVIGEVSCKTSFEMKTQNLNRRLTRHAISEYSVASHHDCARECMSFLVCKSIDFHTKDKMCKLNDVDSQSVNEAEFEVKSGAVFSDIMEWPTEMVSNCGSKPCTASQRCVPVGDTFTCIESACSHFPEINHGKLVVVDLIKGKAKIKCDPGYYADGDPNIMCHGAGKWIKVPTCSKATDCLDVLRLKPLAASDIYDVMISETEQLIPVYCDMDTEGGGWTVFQRRFDGSVDFYRTFEEYETGFGDLHGEFWLGLKKIQEMTKQESSDVRTDVVTAGGRAEYTKYSDFQLVNGDLYELALNQTSLTGTVPEDTFGKHAGNSFSTKDRDYDTDTSISCAEAYQGGWWYGHCSRLNLNGIYEVPGTESTFFYGNAGVTHREVDGLKSLKETKMMFRRT